MTLLLALLVMIALWYVTDRLGRRSDYGVHVAGYDGQDPRADLEWQEVQAERPLNLYEWWQEEVK